MMLDFIWLKVLVIFIAGFISFYLKSTLHSRRGAISYRLIKYTLLETSLIFLPHSLFALLIMFK
jgi:hypothetical protein